MKEPLVSVKMITYNHEPYIAQAIEGVLRQETSFPFELVIGEDCSTDGTLEIVFDYQKKYPDIIRVITSDQNVGMRKNGLRTQKACRGKYMALCEGDDYWTSPHKLQKQVDFLDNHAECSMCFHNVLLINEDDHTEKQQKFYRHPMKSFYSLEDLAGGNFIHTCSVMNRSGLVTELPIWFYEMPMGDWPHHMLHAQHGLLGYIDEVLAAYRIHRGGIWSSKKRIEILEDSIFALETINRELQLKCKRKVRATINRWLCEALRISLDHKDFRNAGSYGIRLMLNRLKK
ncbi:MAG TPA: glycosyltransferase [Sedimentisphaerales bacterium]|nr:glycosyltransferase [Sedimentisphaerales bacterium]